MSRWQTSIRSKDSEVPRQINRFIFPEIIYFWKGKLKIPTKQDHLFMLQSVAIISRCPSSLPISGVTTLESKNFVPISVERNIVVQPFLGKL